MLLKSPPPFQTSLLAFEAIVLSLCTSNAKILESEIGNPLPSLHGLLFPFYMYHPTDRIIPTTAFGTPIMEHW